MKNVFLLLIILCLSQISKAEMPEYLKGAEYIVILKNGKQYSYSSEQMKLVARKPEVKISKTLPPEPKVRVVETIKEVKVTKPTFRPYSLGLYIGRGPTRLKLDRTENGVDVISDIDFIAGVSLSYHLNYDWALRASVLTNNTFLLGADWKLGEKEQRSP
jgi:hypothetical protein